MTESDILDFLDHVGAERVHVANGNVQFSCILAPWTHQKRTDGRPSMGIRITGPRPSPVNCFSCGFGSLSVGKLIDRIELLSGQDVDDDLRFHVMELEERDPVEEALGIGDYEQGIAPVVVEETFPEVCYERFIHDRYHSYILDRGFTPATLATYGVGYDREKERVTFPLRNRDGRLVGCLGRAVDDREPKYWTYWGTQKARHLFGLHLATKVQCENMTSVVNGLSFVVVEGPCDALRVWQETRGDSRFSGILPVAIMGSKPSRGQVELLRRHAATCTFLLDNDEAGRAGTRSLLDNVADVVPSWVGVYPDDRKDPDSLGKDVVVALLEATIV